MNSLVQYASKTEKYRKVVKPLMERKRRARINACLDQLKDLLTEQMIQNGEHILKMEKIDILEMAVHHLRKSKTSVHHDRESFKNGYINAANEVSRTLAFLPNIDISIGTKIMTHLGQRLNEIQSQLFQPMTTTICMPSPSESTTSSGYVSDDCESTSSSGSDIWRPW